MPGIMGRVSVDAKPACSITEVTCAGVMLIAPGVIAAFAAADRIGVAVALRRSSRGSGASAGASAGVAAAAAGAATGMMSMDSSMRLSMLAHGGASTTQKAQIGNLALEIARGSRALRGRAVAKYACEEGSGTCSGTTKLKSEQGRRARWAGGAE